MPDGKISPEQLEERMAGFREEGKNIRERPDYYAFRGKLAPGTCWAEGGDQPSSQDKNGKNYTDADMSAVQK